MPVTGKLSLALYEKLGDGAANELVDWFNAIDASYRDDLRKMNELNFARLDLRIEQRCLAIESVLARVEAKIDSLSRP